MIYLPPANEIECGVSGSLFAASTDALDLGIDVSKWPAKYPPIYVTFKTLNTEVFNRATGGAKALQWTRTALTATAMLSQKWGVYGAHVYYVDPKDRIEGGFGTTYGFDDTPHMIVWKPERRIFFVNPGLVVFTASEVMDIAGMVKTLFFQHGIYFAPEHNTSRVRLLTLEPASKNAKLTNYSFKAHFTPAS